MRSEKEILDLILQVANNNPGIKAVLLTGSRANPDIIKDKYQDFDIIYIVSEMNSFIKNHSWIDVFGERIILQSPDEMTIGKKDPYSFHYLMLFKDHNRIDLTLFPIEKIKTEFKTESFTVLLLDKNNLFEKIPPPSDKDYLIKRPAEKDFIDCCNEFWWVITYVAKGLCRNEIIYAKEKFEVTVRAMFLKMIEWHTGVLTNFTSSSGQSGRNIKHYLPESLYNKILSTYPDSEPGNIWKSVFAMTEIFGDLAEKVAESMNFYYNNEEELNVKEYLGSVYETVTAS